MKKDNFEVVNSENTRPDVIVCLPSPEMPHQPCWRRQWSWLNFFLVLDCHIANHII